MGQWTGSHRARATASTRRPATRRVKDRHAPHPPFVSSRPPPARDSAPSARWPPDRCSVAAPQPAPRRSAPERAVANTRSHQGGRDQRACTSTSTALQNGVSLTVIGDTGTTSGAQTLTVKKAAPPSTWRRSWSGPPATSRATPPRCTTSSASPAPSRPSTPARGSRSRRRTASLAELVSGLLNSQVAYRAPDGRSLHLRHRDDGARPAGRGRSAATVSDDSGGKVPDVLYVPASGIARSPSRRSPTRPRRQVLGHSRHGDVLEVGREDQRRRRLPTRCRCSSWSRPRRAPRRPRRPRRLTRGAPARSGARRHHAELVDAVVNAANSGLRGGGGVDGAIHRAAGADRLQAACRAIGGCAPGDAVVTDGFALPARFIIHTVGPVWRGGRQARPRSLASCYAAALAVADEVGARSVAFPGHLDRCVRLSLRARPPPSP